MMSNYLAEIEPNQTNANSALKVLYIEQLGLADWIRTTALGGFEPARSHRLKASSKVLVLRIVQYRPP